MWDPPIHRAGRDSFHSERVKRRRGRWGSIPPHYFFRLRAARPMVRSQFPTVLLDRTRSEPFLQTLPDVYEDENGNGPRVVVQSAKITTVEGAQQYRSNMQGRARCQPALLVGYGTAKVIRPRIARLWASNLNRNIGTVPVSNHHVDHPLSWLA